MIVRRLLIVMQTFIRSMGFTEKRKKTRLSINTRLNNRIQPKANTLIGSLTSYWNRKP
ncbi:MAG: hypothetical protein PWK00_10860 [Coxiella burnetii]|nr:hypothetical protein [Coxiella burnetii]